MRQKVRFSLILCLFALGVLLAKRPLISAVAKEIEATNEWTLVGENDTVAAGMHIRMDLTTGEKWVKLLDENDGQTNKVSNTQTSKEVQVIVDSTGDTSLVPKPAYQTGEEDAQPSGHGYDFDMMHRTLSKLPQEERERMQLPPKPEDSLSPEAREHFERRMKEIWEHRQEELLNLELADLPQLLKDRIRAIRDYLDDPATELLQLLDGELDNSTIKADENEIVHIIDVLRDLEYHLQDLDMARDFHTLGGWSLLSSLLHDDVHYSTVTIARTKARTNNTNTAEISRGVDNHDLNDNVDVAEQVHQVQMYAAWALGTAVKNTQEFAPYVLEKIHNNKIDGLTALELVHRQLQASLQGYKESASIEVETKILRLVYCLGSFLRGNRDAQINFGAAGGPSLIADTLQSIVSGEVKAFNSKLASRLLNLAADTVLDVAPHGSNDVSNDGNSVLDRAIVAAWTSAEWCTAVASALTHPSLVDPALSATQALTGQCKSTWQSSTSVLDAINQIRVHMETSTKEDDPELLQEKSQKIDWIVNLLAT